jgi:hypothetical protein
MRRRDEAKPLPYLAAVLVADVEETKRAIEEAAGELRAVLSKWDDGVATDALGRVLGETVRRRGDFDDIWVHPEGEVYARPVKRETPVPSAAELNQRLGDIDGDGLPFFCEHCGASRSIGPVTDVPGVRGECRECHVTVPALPGSEG